MSIFSIFLPYHEIVYKANIFYLILFFQSIFWIPFLSTNSGTIVSIITSPCCMFNPYCASYQPAGIFILFPTLKINTKPKPKLLLEFLYLSYLLSNILHLTTKISFPKKENISVTKSNSKCFTFISTLVQKVTVFDFLHITPVLIPISQAILPNPFLDNSFSEYPLKALWISLLVLMAFLYGVKVIEDHCLDWTLTDQSKPEWSH